MPTEAILNGKLGGYERQAAFRESHVRGHPTASIYRTLLGDLHWDRSLPLTDRVGASRMASVFFAQYTLYSIKNSFAPGKPPRDTFWVSNPIFLSDEA